MYNNPVDLKEYHKTLFLPVVILSSANQSGLLISYSDTRQSPGRYQLNEIHIV